MNRELRASTRAVLHGHGAAMPFDRILYQAEPEPGTPDLHDIGWFAAEEGFEDAIPIPFRYAWATIGDADLHSIRASRRRDSDPLALRGVSYGIPDQVAKSMFERDGVPGNRG